MDRKIRRKLKCRTTLFQNKHFEACVNRSYYAAFHAAIGVLLFYGYRNDKNGHEWVQSTFVRELIHRRKLFPKAFQSILIDLLITRNDADYSIDKVSAKLAQHHLKKSINFLESIKIHLSL